MDKFHNSPTVYLFLVENRRSLAANWQLMVELLTDKSQKENASEVMVFSLLPIFSVSLHSGFILGSIISRTIWCLLEFVDESVSHGM